MSKKVGRNDSCPCGSGKKYKKCCLRVSNSANIEPIDFAWKELNRLNNQLLIEHLIPYIKSLGPNYLDQALGDFFPEYLHPRMLKHEEGITAVCAVPWAAVNWAPFVDLGHPQFDHGKTVAENYLIHHGDKLNSRQRTVLDVMIHSYYSFYRVLEVTLDESMVVEDTILRTTHLVKEKSATHCANEGDIIFSKILTVGNTSVFTGMAPLSIPSKVRYQVISFSDWLRKQCKGSLSKKKLREDYEVEVLDAYFDILNSAYEKSEGILVNTDDEEILFVTSKYKLDLPISEAVDKLNVMTLGKDIERKVDSHIYESTAMVEVRFPWLKSGNAQHEHFENTVIGWVEIDTQGHLLLATNSHKRSEKGKALLEELLGDSITYLHSIIETPEEKMKSMPARSENEPLGGPPTEEMQEQIEAFLKSHWEKWFVTTVPALDGMTPREASKSEYGRELLEELFRDYEEQNIRHPNNLAKPDTDYLRSELGIAEYHE